MFFNDVYSTSPANVGIIPRHNSYIKTVQDFIRNIYHHEHFVSTDDLSENTYKQALVKRPLQRKNTSKSYLPTVRETTTTTTTTVLRPSVRDYWILLQQT